MSFKPQPADATYAPKRLADGGADTRDERAIAALVAELPSALPEDVAVERVWRRVIAPEAAARRQAPFWMPVVAVAVVAMITLVTIAGPFWRGSPAVATVAALSLSSGGVFSSSPSHDWHKSVNGEELREADRLRTDATGHAVFRVRGVAAVLEREGTDLAIEHLGLATSLRLSRGVLTARVSKRKPDEPFVVETERYTITVVGTLFTVEQGPGDRTVVSVREGIVEVKDRRGPVDRVVAGQRWTSDSREIRKDRTADAVKTLLEACLEGRPPAELAAAFTAASLPVAPAESAAGSTGIAPSPGRPVTPAAPSPIPSSVGRGATGAREVGDRAQVGVSAGTSPAPAPVPAPVVGSVVVTMEPATPDESPSARPTAAPAVSVDAPPITSAQPPSSAAAVDEGPYARGLALEGKGDLEAAAKELARAADEDPRHADIALYALGRLAQRRLHDGPRARAAFNRYRARYPQGALLPEVDLAILEIEVDTHAQADALADSARFLAAHPTSERIDEVHLLRGNLLRDAGACQDALVEYAKVRTAPFTDHALYSTAYCQRKLGDRAAAGATLRDYLTRFPSGAHRAEAQQALAEER